MKKLSCLLIVILIFNTQLFGQEIETSNIEEIVVTSQKRANAIAAQDLPVSVTAVSYTHLTLPTNREV